MPAARDALMLLMAASSPGASDRMYPPLLLVAGWKGDRDSLGPQYASVEVVAGPEVPIRALEACLSRAVATRSSLLWLSPDAVALSSPWEHLESAHAAGPAMMVSAMPAGEMSMARAPLLWVPAGAWGAISSMLGTERWLDVAGAAGGERRKGHVAVGQKQQPASLAEIADALSSRTGRMQVSRFDPLPFSAPAEIAGNPLSRSAVMSLLSSSLQSGAGTRAQAAAAAESASLSGRSKRNTRRRPPPRLEPASVIARLDPALFATAVPGRLWPRGAIVVEDLSRTAVQEARQEADAAEAEAAAWLTKGLERMKTAMGSERSNTPPEPLLPLMPMPMQVAGFEAQGFSAEQETLVQRETPIHPSTLWSSSASLQAGRSWAATRELNRRLNS